MNITLVKALLVLIPAGVLFIRAIFLTRHQVSAATVVHRSAFHHGDCLRDSYETNAIVMGRTLVIALGTFWTATIIAGARWRACSSWNRVAPEVVRFGEPFEPGTC
jgi:hypothetical protein